MMSSLAKACVDAFSPCEGRGAVAPRRSGFVKPSAIRWTTVSLESVRLSQPFLPQVRDDAQFDANPAQRAADPAGIGNRFEPVVGET